jgi:large subunit ribosomal protein L10
MARLSPGNLGLMPWFLKVRKETKMDRLQKKELVSLLNSTFGEVPVVIVSRNKGLTVAQVTDLRRKVRDAGASFKVSKNRLTRLALNGTTYEGLGALLTGPCAITTSKDPVAAAKVISAFAKDNEKLEIVGGAMGATVLDPSGVKALAELPSLDELRAKLIGLINAPATKLAQLANAPAAKLARVFKAYAEKDAA